jgi:hypothetical protein
MFVRILRYALTGLLMLSLALPAWALHVCSCGHRTSASRKSTSSASVPLRPCCAKKLAQRTPQSSPVGLRAKCCCDEVRWNQTVAKVTSPRQHNSISELAAVVCLETVPLMSPASRASADSTPWHVLRASPQTAAQILLCRWQV